MTSNMSNCGFSNRMTRFYKSIRRRRGIVVLFLIVFVFCLSSSAVLYSRIGDSSKKIHGAKSVRSHERYKLTCPEFTYSEVSLSYPPSYPKYGTGKIVNLSAEFATSNLNSFCEARPPLTAILPVYSAVENFNRRTAIRDTIGRECGELNCKVMFIIGVSPNVLLMQRLKIEYDNYMDILIVNRIDTHRDLNDKAVAMLDWLLQFCSEAKYVIHFIDDAYINVDYFLDDLETVGPSVYGAVANRPPTVRDRNDIFFVGFDEYPYDHVPNFAVGNAYAFPNSITTALRCAVPKAIYIWIEDIWLMGHVREFAGIQAVRTRRRTEWYRQQSQFGRFRFEDVRDYLFIHSVTVEDFYRLHYIKGHTVKP